MFMSFKYKKDFALDVTIVCKIHQKEIIGHDVRYQPNSLLDHNELFWEFFPISQKSFNWKEI